MFKNNSPKFVIAILAFFFLFPCIKSGRSEILSFFSPQDDVNFHIVRAINGAGGSIDIVVSDVKSHEIAEALAGAANRGVKVRILLSNRKPISRETKLKAIMNNGVKAWILNDKSVVLDNFAVFDNKLLLTGSFSFDQADYQNITFANDRSLVQQYHSRFESFAGLSLLPAENALSQQSGGGGSWDAPSGSGGQWDQQPSYGDNAVDLSFEEMFRLFGRNSTLSRSEKKRLWKDYKGKTITWTGNISYVAWGIVTGDVIGVMHTGHNEVTVSIRKQYVSHVKKLHKGDNITYRGRLNKRPKRFTGFSIKGAEILTR